MEKSGSSKCSKPDHDALEIYLNALFDVHILALKVGSRGKHDNRQ